MTTTIATRSAPSNSPPKPTVFTVATARTSFATIRQRLSGRPFHRLSRKSPGQRIRRALERLESLKSLSPGWDGDNALPPEANACRRAEEFLSISLAKGWVPDMLSPSTSGGVGMTFVGKHREAYVEFFSHGQVFGVLSDGKAEPLIFEIAPNDDSFRASLQRLWKYLYG